MSNPVWAERDGDVEKHQIYTARDRAGCRAGVGGTGREAAAALGLSSPRKSAGSRGEGLPRALRAGEKPQAAPRAGRDGVWDGTERGTGRSAGERAGCLAPQSGAGTGAGRTPAPGLDARVRRRGFVCRDEGRDEGRGAMPAGSSARWVLLREGRTAGNSQEHPKRVRGKERGRDGSGAKMGSEQEKRKELNEVSGSISSGER